MLLPAGKMPLVDTSQAEGFNMSVLKRMDEDILEILYSATHVAVYEFDTGRKSWRRSDIEGTLFLVKRCSAPRFRMIVVNSKRIDNFMEEVDGSLECEVLQTFLLYTKGNNQLYGIWFYDEKNCEEFGNYLKRIVKGMPKASPSGTPTMREKAPTAAEPRSTADLRNELQSIFNQLNCQSGSQPSSGSGSGGQKSTGESDHLMRLFLQAKERSPATSTPLVVATTAMTVQPPSSELPNADIVLSLDNIPTTNQAPSVDAGPSSASVPAVPLVPLPPDFFKPSSKTTLSVPTVTEEHHSLAPDPANLPMPVPESVSTNIRDIGLLGSTVAESNGVVDGDHVASSLRRFFARNENEEAITDNLRDRFRQALVNLLSNDEILDLLIAEFKKVGIPFQ